MDVQAFFPTFKDRVYFDSGASSLTARPVLEKMQEFYTLYRANIHRGDHALTKKASHEYEGVYSKLARFFNAREDEFINVRNTTEAINGVALGLDWAEGDEIIVSDFEHHSNLLPWLALKKKGVIVKVANSDPQGILSAQAFSSLLSRRTRLVAFSACSNVLGASVPVREIAKAAKDNGSLVLVDAAQYVGHHAVDLGKWPVDYLAFSSHKCFGPTGTGVLYHRAGAPLTPWFLGGGTIRTASLEGYELIPTRERFEAGTPAIAEWIGLGAAIDFISKIGYAQIEAHEKELIASMLDAFSGMPNVSLYGPREARLKASALFAFNAGKLPPHQAAIMLDQLGFALRSGHHCAIPVTTKLGVSGTVRASLHLYNTNEQVRQFADVLGKMSKMG